LLILLVAKLYLSFRGADKASSATSATTSTAATTAIITVVIGYLNQFQDPWIDICIHIT